MEAITFELVAERAFNRALRGCRAAFILPDIYSCKKTPKLDTSIRKYSWPDLVELRILPHEAVSGCRSADGKRSGEGRPGDLGHVRSCSNPDRLYGYLNSNLLSTA